jgi:integrase
VSHRDIEILQSCEQRAARFSVSLPAAIEEWTSARELLASGSLIEAARFYVSHHAGLERHTVSELLPAFYESRKAANFSVRYVATLKSQIGKFESMFGSVFLSDITTPQIDEFLRGLKVVAVTRNGTRKSVATFFSWARKQGHLVDDKNTAAQKTMRFSEVDRAPEIFTPEEMQRLLGACSKDVVPVLAISGFCGIRSAEVVRLEWADVLWDQGYIELKARKAKTKARRLVPIQPNLRAWLEPYRGSIGLIFEGNQNYSYRMLAKASGVKWKKNALRHSYASYRLAQIQDAAKVALEMGNSPQILFKHYRELVTPDMAERWFGIFPPATPG